MVDTIDWHDPAAALRALGGGIPAAIRADNDARAPRVASPGLAASAVALAAGRSATLAVRLDADRHLAMRLACAAEGRSAQAVMIAALDAYLGTLPGQSVVMPEDGVTAGAGLGADR